MDDVSKRLLEVSMERSGGFLCDHGVTFDEEAARGLDEYAVRKRWPRLDGRCPKGCGYVGIAYASGAHYACGDW